MKKATEWNRKWPTKPGHYWFFGWPYGVTENFDKTPVAPELNHVRVMRVSNGVLTVRDGSFWSQKEGGIGLFCKINIPAVPDLSGLVPLKEKP